MLDVIVLFDVFMMYFNTNIRNPKKSDNPTFQRSWGPRSLCAAADGSTSLQPLTGLRVVVLFIVSPGLPDRPATWPKCKRHSTPLGKVFAENGLLFFGSPMMSPVKQKAKYFAFYVFAIITHNGNSERQLNNGLRFRVWCLLNVYAKFILTIWVLCQESYVELPIQRLCS